MTNAILTQWTYHGTDGTAFLWERSTDAGSTWPLKMAFPFTASSYLDADVSLYGKYWYKIAAANPKGTGSFSSLAWNSVDGYFAVSDFEGYIYNSPDGINWTLNTINPHVQYNGQYYTWALRLKYDSSLNKFLLFGQAPPS
jgi:hypothetical protein